MTAEELKVILENHKKWIQNENGGIRADLSRANLYHANLCGADLSGANLSCANLSDANLSGANLSGANLYHANLSCANLSGADLSGADLSGANLYHADLYHADLSGANLSDANLFRANLDNISMAWDSHQLISEILLRRAGDDIEKLKIAGLIRIKLNWCWGNFIELAKSDPLGDWALTVLAEKLKPGENHLELNRYLREKAEKERANANVT